MKTTRLRAALSLACSLVVIGLTAMSLVIFFLRTGDGNMAVRGTLAFRYFTVDSNILAAVACVFVLMEAIRARKGGRFLLPRAVQVLKFSGAVSVGLTFGVVMAFLGPLFGYGMMFRGMNLYLHLINPILAMLSFVLLERGAAPLEKKDIFWGVLPMVVYGIFYLVLVVALGRWPDFYGFNMGGLWYVSYIAVLLGTAAIAALLRLVHNALSKKETNSTYKE